MRFELEPYHRNTPDSDLIADLRSVAIKLGKGSVTVAEYRASGKFGSKTIENRFGGWSLALDKAGLEVNRERGITNDDLFNNLERVWTKLGRQPRYSEFRRPLSRYSVFLYERRFGGWRKALEAFVSWINSEETPDSSEDADIVQPEGQPENNEHMDQADDRALAQPASIISLASAQDRGPRQPGRRLLMAVLIRDNGVCQVCKRVFTENGPDYHIDHIKPWINGGPTILENLQLLCSKCNLLKGALDLTSGTEIEVQNVNA